MSANKHRYNPDRSDSYKEHGFNFSNPNCGIRDNQGRGVAPSEQEAFDNLTEREELIRQTKRDLGTL